MAAPDDAAAFGGADAEPVLGDCVVVVVVVGVQMIFLPHYQFWAGKMEAVVEGPEVVHKHELEVLLLGR